MHFCQDSLINIGRSKEQRLFGTSATSASSNQLCFPNQLIR